MLELSLQTASFADGMRHTLHLHRQGSNHSTSDRCFVFDLLGERNRVEPSLLDGYVFGVLFLAMQEGAPLRVHGQLSSSAQFNVHEFQGAWSTWRPKRYRRIDVLPDAIIECLPTPRAGARAIAAYSGGVDGTFTALRHRQGLEGGASYPLTDVMLVHGFDVPLARADSFDLVQRRVRPILDELGLNVRTVRTDLKEMSGQDWEDSFAAQLAACLHCSSQEFRYALLGSGQPYPHVVFPWGSNPMTDPLLSGDRMRLVLDGLPYGRTEKLALVSRHPTALRGLKVCWEGPDPARNCGQCEKCVRTKLNFLAVGADPLVCFDEPLDLGAVDRILIRNRPQFQELVDVVEYARAHGRSGPWLEALERRIARHRRRPSLPQRALRKLRRTLGIPAP